MRTFALFFRNFLSRAFQSKLAYLLHFAVPVASFLAMYLLLRLNQSAAFAGTQAIGLVVYFTMLQAVMVVGLVLKDREQGVMSRIVASPAPRLAYVLGNGAAALAVLLAQLAFFTVFISFILPVPTGLGFLPLLGILAAYAIACVGFAFLICALSDSSSSAMILANVAAMFSSLMGGSFFPAEYMSPSMQRLAFAFPQYWAMKAIKQAQSPAPSGALALSIIILLLFGAFFLAVQAAVASRRRSAA